MSGHSDGASQGLGTLRAERSSAPTDLRRKNLCTVHVHVVNLCAIIMCEREYTDSASQEFIPRIVYALLIYVDRPVSLITVI